MCKFYFSREDVENFIEKEMEEVSPDFLKNIYKHTLKIGRAHV